MIIKNEKERTILRKGGKYLGTILARTAKKCVPGVTLLELNDYARELMDELKVKSSFFGYGYPPFPAVLCISVNDGIVHGIPDGYILKQGDILTLDGGVWYEGLATDAAITIGVGNISKEDYALINAAYEAREAQIDAAIVGNTVGDISAASEFVARSHGYNYPEELGGHGVGREVHEDPFIATAGKAGTGKRLVEGMVLALEPIVVQGNGRIKLSDDSWLYSTVDGSRSAQFEHTIIVGKERAEVITEPQ